MLHSLGMPNIHTHPSNSYRCTLINHNTMNTQLMRSAYFIVKCKSYPCNSISHTISSLMICIHGDIEHSQSTHTWATPLRAAPPHPHQTLANAFNNSHHVILIFSVNKSRRYSGYASLLEVITSDVIPSNNDPMPMSPPFSIKWEAKFAKVESGVSFDRTQSLVNSSDNNSSINNSRNCQEIPEDIGRTLCEMIDAEIVNERELIQRQADAKAQPQSLISSDDWGAFSQEISKYGSIQFLSPYGSRFYNLHTPTSDIDMCGIFVADINQWLGVQKPLITVKNPNNTKPDYILHEVSHFVKLVARGDHRMIELLFTHPNVVVSHTDQWDQLVKHKQSFICLEMAKKYLSEIDGSKGISLVKTMILRQPDDPEIAKISLH